MLRLQRVLRRIGVDLRPGEALLATALFLYSFLLGAFQFSTKAVRQASFIDVLGAEKLPWVYLLVALCAYPVLRLHEAAARRFRSPWVILITLGVVAAGLSVFWVALADPGPVASAAYYIWIGIASALVLSQFWGFVNQVFHARQARRLFGFIGGGSLLGGALGGQVARLASEEPRNALWAAIALLSAIAFLILTNRDHWPEEGVELADGERSRGGGGEAAPTLSGLGVVWRSRHLRLIAAILFITVVVSQAIDLQFNWVVERNTTSLAERTALFGNLYTIMGLAAFVFQILFTARIHRTLGVRTAMRILPGFILVFSALFWASTVFAPALAVLAVTTLRVGENGLRYSLDHATRELLFVAVPTAERKVAKAYIDVLVHRLAKAVSAVLLLTVTFGLVTVPQASYAVVALVIVWWLATGVAGRRYVEALRAGLVSIRDRAAADEGPDLRDVTTLELLIESLGSADPDRVLRSVDLLVKGGRAHLVPPLLLHHDSADVRQRVLEVIARAGRKDALSLIELRLADPVQDVRAAAVRALASLAGTDRRHLMVPRLDDPDPRVRAAAISCLAADDDLRQEVGTALEAMVGDGDPEVRAEVAKALAEPPDPVFQAQLIRLLFDSEPDVRREAIAAVRRRWQRGACSPLYVPILVSLLHDRRLKHDARDALQAFGSPVIPALHHFVRDQNEHIWVRRAIPKTLARVGGHEACSVLWESLDEQDDLMLRRKLIEALGSLRDLDHDPDASLRQLARECRAHMTALAQLSALTPLASLRSVGATLEWVDGEPSLLQRMLLERAAEHLENAFHLLEIHISTMESVEADPAEVRAACRQLLDPRPRVHARALEFLDNVLEGEARRWVMSVIDDRPLAERLEKGCDELGIERRDAVGVLDDLLREEKGVEGSRWLAAAALSEIGARGMRSFYSRVQELATDAESELVRETAQWVERSALP